MVKNIQFLFLVILFVSCNKHIQVENNLNSDAFNVEQHIKSSIDYKLSDSLRNVHLENACLLVNQLNNSPSKNKYLIQIAYNNLMLGNWENFKSINYEIIKSAEQINDTLSLANAQSYLGYYYQYKYFPDSAFYYYSKGLKSFSSLNIDLEVGKMLLSIATIQESVKDFTGCEINSIKAIPKLKNAKDYRNLYLAYNILGVIYKNLNHLDLAIEQHEIAIGYLKKIDNEFLKATSLNNIGRIYVEKGDYLKSIEYFKKAKGIKGLFESRPKTYAMLLDNLAYSKFKLRDYSELPNLFYKSLQIRDSLKIYDGMSMSYLHLSEYYLSKKDTLQAINYGYKAKYYAKEANYNDGLLESYQLLSKIEPKENGLAHLNKYIKLSDSLKQQEREIREKFTRIAYETNEITKKKEEEEKKNWLLTITLIIGVAFFTLVFTYIRQRSKNKELVFNKKQDESNVEIYNLMLSQQSKFQEGSNKEKERIAEELHDDILGRLFGTRLSLDSLNEGITKEEINEREEYIEELQIIEEDIRKISHNLKTNLFNSNISFRKLVEELVTKQSKIGNFEGELNFKNSIDWENISNSIKINCYRIIQESLQNIIKHAKASEVTIEFNEEDKNIILSIKDNGLGYINKNKNIGIGQKNMISRVKSLKGKIEFRSSLGKGTEVIIKIPL